MNIYLLQVTIDYFRLAFDIQSHVASAKNMINHIVN